MYKVFLALFVSCLAISGLYPDVATAQLYDPSDLSGRQENLREFVDQFGRHIYINNRNQIVRIVEPSSYPEGITPPPLSFDRNNTQNAVVGGGAPSDDVLAEKDGLPENDAPAIEMPKGPQAREAIASLQILMARLGASPGAIDGIVGSNFDKAAAAAGQISGKFIDPNDHAAIETALMATGGPAFTHYIITQVDINQTYVASIPADYALKAQMPAMAYTSVREMLAEKFHIDEAYLQALNPTSRFTQSGETIVVPNLKLPQYEPVTRIEADKIRKQVRGFNAEGKLVVAYPSTIGSSDNPSPSGTVQVERIALNPNYTYNPHVNFRQGDNNTVLTIPPGPNGPVGTVWIALSKPTYGIHGTPEPSRIGKTSSHGCIRLTNWDAEQLAHLVKKGVTVEFVD